MPIDLSVKNVESRTRGARPASKACRAGGTVRRYDPNDEEGDGNGARTEQRGEKSTVGRLQECDRRPTIGLACHFEHRDEDGGPGKEAVDGEGVPRDDREGAARNFQRRFGTFWTVF